MLELADMDTNALSCRAQRRSLAAGFTLIELMVTFAVVAVMLMLAAPSLVSFQRNSELTATANSFAAALSAARAEAMKRQLNTFVRPNPTSSDDWTRGWTVYVDVNWDFSYLAGTDIQITQQSQLSPSISIVTNSTPNDAVSHYLMFSGSGFLRNVDGSFGASRALQLGNGSESRFVIVNPAGRVRVCNPATAPTGSCDATDAF